MQVTLLAIAALWLAALAVIVPGESRAAAFDPQKSIEAFKQVAMVLKHRRCMNCLATVNWSTQGDDRCKHTFNVCVGRMTMARWACAAPPAIKKKPTAGNVPGAKSGHITRLGMD